MSKQQFYKLLTHDFKSPIQGGQRNFVMWFAGFFEGEGSVRNFQDGRQPKRICGLEVHQVNPEPIEYIKNSIGGAIYIRKRNGCQPCLTWRLHGAKASRLAFLIFPYLSHKRKRQISPLLNWIDGRTLPSKRSIETGRFVKGARGT